MADSVMIDFLEFTVDATGQSSIDPHVADVLAGYRIVLERWVRPGGHTAAQAVAWVADAAFAFVSNAVSADELREEGYKFRLWTPQNVLVLDTITRDGEP